MISRMVSRPDLITLMEARPSVERRMSPGEPKITSLESAGDTAMGPVPAMVTASLLAVSPYPEFKLQSELMVIVAPGRKDSAAGITKAMSTG